MIQNNHSRDFYKTRYYRHSITEPGRDDDIFSNIREKVNSGILSGSFDSIISKITKIKSMSELSEFLRFNSVNELYDFVDNAHTIPEFKIVSDLLIDILQK
jgi:enolase